MSYRVLIVPSAAKELENLPAADRKRVNDAICELSSTPRPIGVKKLEGRYDEYRIRVGRYRVVFLIDDRNQEVRVYRVGHRGRVYRGR